MTIAAAVAAIVCNILRVYCWSELMTVGGGVWSVGSEILSLLTEVLAGEVGHQAVNLLQLLGRREENDTQESVGRVGAEPRAIDRQHARRAEQREHVVFVGFPR